MEKRKFSKETRKKMSEAKKKYWKELNGNYTERQKKSIELLKTQARKRKEKYGYVNSIETRKKLSKIMKEKIAKGELKPLLNSPFVKGHKSGMTGRKMSKEHKRKIGFANSKALKGKVSPKKGKTYEEIMGKDKADKVKKIRSMQVLPVKDTSIEVKIQNFLKQLRMEFFTHQYMKIEHGYQCDILIPSKNLVIECDGDYWHKYPVGLEKDHIRTEELIDKGFKVLRLWERDIRKMELNDFKEKIKNVD